MIKGGRDRCAAPSPSPCASRRRFSRHGHSPTSADEEDAGKEMLKKCQASVDRLDNMFLALEAISSGKWSASASQDEIETKLRCSAPQVLSICITGAEQYCDSRACLNQPAKLHEASALMCLPLAKPSRPSSNRHGAVCDAGLIVGPTRTMTRSKLGFCRGRSNGSTIMPMCWRDRSRGDAKPRPPRPHSPVTNQHMPACPRPQKPKHFF